MTDRNDHRLLSSLHSGVTPRKRHRSVHSKVSRQRSVDKYGHRRKRRNSTKSTTIIHTRIHPHSCAVSADRSKSVDTFPSLKDLINADQNRKQSLNERLNNTTQHRTLSQEYGDLEQVKRSSTHSHRAKKRLSKSSKVIPFDSDISPSSSKTATEWSSRKGSTNNLRDIIEKTRKRKKPKKFYCSFCPCLLGLLLLGLFLGIIFTVLLLQFLPKSTTTYVSTLSTNLSTSASTVTTTTSKTTSTTSKTTSTTTSTTTTVHYVCGPSCANQSWISTIDLLAEWEFDNNLIEDVTNSVTNSDQSPTYVTGYTDQGLLFAVNANQSITSSSITLTTISFTIEAWIYPTGFPNTQEHSIVGLCPLSSNYECLYLTIHEDSGNHILFFGLYGDDCPGSSFISLNEWIHVAFVFETNSYTQNIYINGKLDVTRTAAGPFKASSSSVTIGNIPVVDSFAGPNYFQGIIDRVTVTGRDKPSCEILEDATLAAYFSFDSSSSLTDLGPNSLSAVAQSVSFTSTGHSLQAISLNGSNSSYFQVSGLTGLGITNRPFSISFWIRPQSLTGTLVHVSANALGSGWCIPFLGFATNGSVVAQMFNGGVRSVIGPSIPLAPTWTHIVETWGPANGLRLYIDNILVASTTLLANSYTASGVPNYIIVGNSLNGVGSCNAGALGSLSPFNGDIDELRIYSRELNADDICTLYTR